LIVTDAAGRVDGTVVDIMHESGRGSPIALVQFSDGKSCCLSAPEGIIVSQTISRGAESPPEIGNILPVGKIPEGTMICNIEREPGDGGKFVRSAGTTAFIVAHEEKFVTVRMPSKQIKTFDPRCRAQIGVVCGGGHTEKPMMKAGKMHYKAHARNMTWPHVRGVAMNAVDHPFGGGQHHPGKSTCVGRGTPPGRKVGHLAARTVGRLSAAKQELKRQQRIDRSNR